MNRTHIGASDVREALDMVGLLEEISQLPDGLNTKLTTGGAPLSQGQAQRLAIARAVVGQPRLLLIDGSLDAVAGPNLEVLMDRLCAPESPWTLLVASGRDEVIRHCQDIIHLEGSVSQNETREPAPV